MSKISQYKSNHRSLGKYPPDICHEAVFDDPILSYEKMGQRTDFTELIRERFLAVLGDMPREFTPICHEQCSRDCGEYTAISMLVETERGVMCPCELLLPKGVEKPPVVICLQGHSMGMMVSLGQGYGFGDLFHSPRSDDEDFAIQALSHGYAAMIMEQRGFGMRRSAIGGGVMCDQLAHTALLVGRTLIGERVWDVSQIITLLRSRGDIDTDRLGIMGNSGGGTASFYAACFDERISYVMPSCSVCSYYQSIGTRFHCACNYLPAAAKYFDMGELACLIYPRPLIVVAGDADPIFPYDGVQKVHAVMRRLYADKPDNLRLVTGKGGHRFYREAWDVYDDFVKGNDK